nr:MAG TPA: hypothetical protein [Microviridae sp.]
MGSRIRNQKNRRYLNEKQDFKAYKDRGGIEDRAESLRELIGLERVVRRDFGYEGTYYVTEDGETYDDEYVDTHNPRRTGVKFYEVSNWRYNKRKEIYEPIIRRIVMIDIKEIQLTLDL